MTHHATAFATSLTLASLLAVSACASSPGGTPSSEAPVDAAEEFTVTSPDLGDDGFLPDWAINSVPGLCAGTENRSPRLEWSGAPEGTVEFLLTMTDPTHPQYVHWVVTNIDSSVTSLEAADDGEIGVGTTGVNWQGAGQYAGVCLPNNTYRYTVYALDTDIPGESTTDLEAALALVEGHVLAEAHLNVKGH